MVTSTVTAAVQGKGTVTVSALGVTGGRLTPDVSFNGAAQQVIYDSKGQMGPLSANFISHDGGSSMATPQWAGLVAIANQLRQAGGETGLAPLTTAQVLQQMYGPLYASSSTYFHQPSIGKSTPDYVATNYNSLGGLGSPVANLLVPALAGPEVTFGAPSAPASPGAPFQVTVTLTDAVTNQPVTGYTGTIRFSSSDPAAGLPASYTFTPADRGSHTFTFTLNTPGAQTITATDGTWTYITGSTSVPVNLPMPGPSPTTTTLVDSANPSNVGDLVNLTAFVAGAPPSAPSRSLTAAAHWAPRPC